MSKEIFVPYGATIRQETRDEAIERVKKLVKDSKIYVCFKDECVDLEHGYLENRNYRSDVERIRESESQEVFKAVEQYFVQEKVDKIMEDRRIAEEKKAAAHAAYIAAQKAKYDRWQIEAKEMGISFKELCEMKHAECIESYDDDWDD